MCYVKTGKTDLTCSKQDATCFEHCQFTLKLQQYLSSSEER